MVKKKWCVLPLLLFLVTVSGCGSVYMTAEDRYQQNGKISESVEMETANNGELTAYENASTIEPDIYQIAKVFSGLTQEEVEKGLIHDGHEDVQKIVEITENDKMINVYTSSSGNASVRNSADADWYDSMTAVPGEENAGMFEALRQWYPQTELDGLSPEDALKICEDAMEQADLPCVYEQTIVLDPDSMGKLSALHYSFQDPENTSEKNEDNTEKPGAYVLYFRVLAGEHPLVTVGGRGYVKIICGQDEKIILMDSDDFFVNPESGKPVQRKVISAEEAYQRGQGYLQEHGKASASITQVNICYTSRYVTETTRNLEPCWEIRYQTESNGSTSEDSVFLDAVSGQEINRNEYY